jgi:hypothetical protein
LGFPVPRHWKIIERDILKAEMRIGLARMVGDNPDMFHHQLAGLPPIYQVGQAMIELADK